MYCLLAFSFYYWNFEIDCLKSVVCVTLIYLSCLQLSSANRVTALTSRDGILWAQGIPNVKNQRRESIENAYYWLNKCCQLDKFVIRSVTDVLRTKSMFVKCVGVWFAASTSTNLTNLLSPQSKSVTDLITNKGFTDREPKLILTFDLKVNIAPFILNNLQMSFVRKSFVRKNCSLYCTHKIS